MGEAKHTPGPWFWALDRQDQRTSLMRSGSGDYVVCPQADVENYGLSVNPWNDVSDEDARLIAAAPDLLEALRSAWALMENGRDGPDPYGSVCGLLPAGGVECENKAEEVRDILRAAIAKATGQ